jgi:hypothetical protein
MILKLTKYSSFICIYLYFIIVGFELVSIEHDVLITNTTYYNYITYINILYIGIVVYFIYKIVELLHKYKCSNAIYLQEYNEYEHGNFCCLISIYSLMLMDLMMYLIYVWLSIDYIDNYKDDFMALSLYRLYYYPKLILSIIFSCFFVIILLNLSFVCIDGFFFNRGIHMYIEHKIEDKKTTTKINTIIKRRNRISITNDIT